MRFRVNFAIALAAAGVAAMGAVFDGVQLKRTAKTGDTIKYKMKAEVDIKGSTASFSGLVTEKVSKVAADGTYTFESKSTDGKVVYGGTTTVQADTAATLTVKSNGELQLVVSEQDDPNMFRMMNLQTLRFADKPVQVGDSWDVVITHDDRGSFDAKGTCKVEAKEQEAGHDCLRVHETLKETIDKDPISVDALYWIDPKDGSTAAIQGTWTNAPFPKIGPVTTKVTMVRQDG